MFVCPACGQDALSADGRIVPTNKLPKEFLSYPFTDSAGTIPRETKKQIAAIAPAYAKSASSWSKYSLLDAMVIASAIPDVVWEMPFETLPAPCWTAIWQCCNAQPFYVKRFLASNDAGWLRGAAGMGLLDERGLSYAAEALARRPSPETDAGVNAFAKFIAERVDGHPTWTTAIEKFPMVVQQAIFSVRPDCPGLTSEEIVSLLSPKIAVEWLADSHRRDVVLRNYPFEKFDTAAWRAALKVVVQDEYGRFASALKVAWEKLEIGRASLYSVLSENPACLSYLPTNEFSTDDFVYLLPYVDSDGYDLAALCPFEKFTKAQWVELLSNARIRVKGGLATAFHEQGVPKLLGREDKGRILLANPSLLGEFGLADVPIDAAIDFILSNPDAEITDDGFLEECSKGQAMRLLCSVKRPPSCTQKMLSRNSRQAFTDDEVEELVRRNSALCAYLPPDRIATLSAEAFLMSARRMDGADFWMSAYDLNALPRAALVMLVLDYPWLAERISYDDWAFDDLEGLFKAVPSLWRRYGHKFRYLAHKWRKTCAAAVLCIVVGIAYGAFCLAMFCMAQYVNAKENARRNEVEIAKSRNFEIAKMERDKAVALQNAKASEADIARRETAELEKEKCRLLKETAENEAKKAQASAQEAEAQARKAEAERDAEEKKRQTAKEEIALQRETKALERERIQQEAENVLDELCRALANEDIALARLMLEKVRNRPYLKDQKRIADAEKFIVLLDRAQSGDVEAQIDLVEQYENGNGFAVVSRERAGEWRKKIAKSKEALLKFAVGKCNAKDYVSVRRALGVVTSPEDFSSKECYLLGRLCLLADDKGKHEEYLTTAATAGYVPAMMWLASECQKRGDYAAAYKWYELAADAGEGDAYYWLGVMDGTRGGKYGRTYDRGKALKAMRNAAAKGTTYANVEEWLRVLDGGNHASYTIKTKPRSWLEAAKEDLKSFRLL